jgi:hypothetical protein
MAAGHGNLVERCRHRLLREQIEGIWGAGRTDLIARNHAADAVDHMPVARPACGYVEDFASLRAQIAGCKPL